MENEFYDEDLRVPLKREKRRTKLLAILLTVNILISLVFLVYAFIQKTETDRMHSELQVVQAQLDQCGGQ